MTGFDWRELSAAAVAPVVVVSACGLLCLALYNRLAAVVARLRMFERERIATLTALAEKQAAGQGEGMAARRDRRLLRITEEQIGKVTYRAVLLQRALLLLLGSICAMLACSLLSGLAMLWQPVMYGALVGFTSGVLLMLCGVGYAIAEMRRALDPVRLEESAVDELANVLAGDADAGE